MIYSSSEVLTCYSLCHLLEILYRKVRNIPNRNAFCKTFCSECAYWWMEIGRTLPGVHPDEHFRCSGSAMGGRPELALYRFGHQVRFRRQSGTALDYLSHSTPSGLPRTSTFIKHRMLNRNRRSRSVRFLTESVFGWSALTLTDQLQLSLESHLPSRRISASFFYFRLCFRCAHAEECTSVLFGTRKIGIKNPSTITQSVVPSILESLRFWPGFSTTSICALILPSFELWRGSTTKYSAIRTNLVSSTRYI